MLREAAVIREVLEADVLINIPIAKSHAASRYTGALKNWMGIIEDRMFFHTNFGAEFKSREDHGRHLAQCIAEINTRIRPTLTIIDATTIMKTRGPQGPGVLERKDQVIAGIDPVALDAYAVSLFDTLKREDVWSLDRAAKLGLGEGELLRITIEDVA